MLTAGVVYVWVLPAASVTVTCAVRPAPSPLTWTEFVVGDTTPEPGVVPSASLSSVVKSNVLAWLVQASAAGAAVVKLRLGAVLSILIAPKVALEVLPALSVQVAVADWLAPSAVLVTSPAAAGMPDPESAQLKLTRTSLFAHVFAV